MKRSKTQRNNRGITLIALVITIIVLLILAAVSISMLTGENGILTQAQRAKEKTEAAASEEELNLSLLDEYISKYTGDNNLDFIKVLNIKGLYRMEMEMTDVEEKKLAYRFDCIRERDGELYREDIICNINSNTDLSEINLEEFEVESSTKIDNIEDLAMPLYYLLIEQDQSKIESVEGQRK